MDNLIKLPFLETNISLLDFNKLENNGYLRTIFIELLKAEKIKNIIPTKYLIKASAEELLLKNKIDQLKKNSIIRNSHFLGINQISCYQLWQRLLKQRQLLQKEHLHLLCYKEL